MESCLRAEQPNPERNRQRALQKYFKMSIETLIDEMSSGIWKNLGLLLPKRTNFLNGVNGQSPSKQFAMAESTFETFPMKDKLGRWELSIGTLTENLQQNDQFYYKEAPFFCITFSIHAYLTFERRMKKKWKILKNLVQSQICSLRTSWEISWEVLFRGKPSLKIKKKETKIHLLTTLTQQIVFARNWLVCLELPHFPWF